MLPVIALHLAAAAPLAAASMAIMLPWRLAAWLSVPAAVCVLGSGIALGRVTGTGGAVTTGVLRADALSSFLLIAIGAVATIACWSGVTYLHHEATSGAATTGIRRYLVLVQLFLACMSLAVLADNLGLLWVAVEATTIVTAFLVGQRRTRESVEAAWKYVVLCSVGIAIAFLGIVCVYAAAVAAGAHGTTALDWTYLSAHAHQLDPNLMRLAAGLVLLGFGTKAGLAPMHAWLPDAHSQAPAPVSALMSGVLLSVSFYAIMRFKTVADGALGPGYARTLLMVGALASLLVAVALLTAQRDYKRMLAYSSIEHMGLVALGTAIGGPLAVAAVLLHILGHGLAKAVAFCGAGQILHATASTGIFAARGLAARAPVLAACFGLTIVALLGLPPFALFASELAIARAGFASGFAWAIAAAFGLVLIAFASVARQTGVLLLAGTSSTWNGPGPTRGWAPLALGLAAAAALGIWIGPLQRLLEAAAHTVGGG